MFQQWLYFFLYKYIDSVFEIPLTFAPEGRQDSRVHTVNLIVLSDMNELWVTIQKLETVVI